MARLWSAHLLLALAAGSVPGQAASSVRGVEAVRAELARQGSIGIVAELARPEGGELTPAAIAAARQRLGRTLAAKGVAEVRALGELPFVALEVDGAQLEALLATGGVVAVAPRRTVKID